MQILIVEAEIGGDTGCISIVAIEVDIEDDQVVARNPDTAALLLKLQDVIDYRLLSLDNDADDNHYVRFMPPE